MAIREFDVRRGNYPSGQDQDADSNSRIVHLRGVVKTYQSAAGTFAALRGIDLDVQAGDFVSIMGKSGSGKSTLINVITGIDRPTSGDVIVDRTPVHRLSEEQIAIWRGRSVGVIFQFFQLLPNLTAVENLLLAMDYGGRWPAAERPHRALALLDRVGVAGLAHRLPGNLSGGQQQCVAVARALANDPVLLAADEPSGNLDSNLLAQQRRQIGVMKAIGGSSRQILGMYLIMVLSYGVMALIISVPLGIEGAKVLSNTLASHFQF
jgi:ABC-type lipoprotein export system ATPase subunit